MNRFLLLILSLACLINLTSCGAMRPPPPNPALVSEIDSYFAAASPKTYPGSGQLSKPPPLSVGQYVITGMTGPEGRSVMQMAVVDQQAQGWVIETRSLTPSSESTSQMLLAGLESSIDGDLGDIDILWVKMKIPGQPVQTIEGPILQMTKGLYKKGLSGLVTQKTDQAAPGGTLKTAAGTFTQTVKVRSNVSFLGRSYPSEAWLHPAVPINGMVKSVSGDGTQTVELLSFGLSGAKKSF